MLSSDNKMKTYIANDELCLILKQNDFIETTPEVYRKKGKKIFKLAKNSKRSICFDYDDIKILNSPYLYDIGSKITEPELKSLLLYFKLNTIELKEIDQHKGFSVTKIIKRVGSLYEELDITQKMNISGQRQRKIAKILDLHVNIKLN